MCVCFEGCLKAQASSLFIPSLPTEKMEVIEKLCFGNIAKIFLEYEEAFWESDVGTISLIYEDDIPASVSTNKMQWLKNMQYFSVLRPKERLMLYQTIVTFSVIIIKIIVISSSSSSIVIIAVNGAKSCSNIISVPQEKNII